jgi:ribosome-associated translation inhibitor RaiA
MKLNLQHVNVRSQDGLDRWVEEQILALGQTRQIDEATVRLECRFDQSPCFAVRIHLATPGPDLFAESRDHTLRAAFTKALGKLRLSIAWRATKRLRQWKGNFAVPVAKIRSMGCL